MRKSIITALALLAAASAATALPSGLSGLSVGIGAGGLTDGYIQGEFDFMLSPYVCLGPEFGFGFGDGGAIYAGGGGRYYIIPTYNYVAQPHVVFSAGLGHRFDKDDAAGDTSVTGLYMTFGFGCDLDIPQSPVSPYLDMGGIFFISDNSDADFKVEAGVRFQVF